MSIAFSNVYRLLDYCTCIGDCIRNNSKSRFNFPLVTLNHDYDQNADDIMCKEFDDMMMLMKRFGIVVDIHFKTHREKMTTKISISTAKMAMKDKRRLGAVLFDMTEYIYKSLAIWYNENNTHNTTPIFVPQILYDNAPSFGFTQDINMITFDKTDIFDVDFMCRTFELMQFWNPVPVVIDSKKMNLAYLINSKHFNDDECYSKKTMKKLILIATEP